MVTRKERHDENETDDDDSCGGNGRDMRDPPGSGGHARQGPALGGGL